MSFVRPRRDIARSESMFIIGIPQKFHKMSLDDFKTYDRNGLNKVLQFVRTYVFNISCLPLRKIGGISFYGSNGVGKTMLASLILKEAYMYRYSAKRTTFQEYINKYTEAWGMKDPDLKIEAEEDFYLNFKAVDFLVLEELGKEIDSKIAVSVLEDLFRYREDRGLCTIMCTNLSPKDVESKYGESILSLMQGNMTPIQIVSVDRRKESFEDMKGEST